MKDDIQILTNSTFQFSEKKPLKAEKEGFPSLNDDMQRLEFVGKEKPQELFTSSQLQNSQISISLNIKKTV
jgi:hypothetical protein